MWQVSEKERSETRGTGKPKVLRRTMRNFQKGKQEKQCSTCTVLPPVHQTQTNNSRLCRAVKASCFNALDFPCTQWYCPPPLFCFKQIRHEVIFSQKQLNRNSLHVALRSWAERGEMITEQQPQTLCVSSKQSAVCVRFTLCFSNIQAIMSLCLLDQSSRPNDRQVFTVDMDFCSVTLLFCVYNSNDSWQNRKKKPSCIYVIFCIRCAQVIQVFFKCVGIFYFLPYISLRKANELTER